MPLVGAIVLVDTMLFAALVPLLPHYVERFDLSKTGAGGLLAAYAAGVLVGGIPAGVLATRVGPRRVVLLGLALMSAASVAFAFAPTAPLLWLARFLQGLGSAASWSGGLGWLLAVTPRDRRGAALGSAMGFAVFGSLLGPPLGGVASVLGTRPTLSAVALVGVALAVWALRIPPVMPDPQPLSAAKLAFRDDRFLAGLWLLLLPALLFGVLDVLVPLRLDEAGWSATAIAALFLAAAVVEAAMNPPLGRLLDRRGPRGPVRVALILSTGVSVVLALVSPAGAVAAFTVLAGVSYGALFAPGLALIAEGADRSGLSQAVAMGVMNGAWAVGNVLGPSAGGALAASVGDAVPYLASAVLCAATMAASARRVRLRGA
jgi:MFS family permease